MRIAGTGLSSRASRGASTFDGGDEKPHGAENWALKNNAPFSLTPLKISEKASITSSNLPEGGVGPYANF